MNEQPGRLYDLRELRTIAEGNDHFLSEMVALFISQSELSMHEIREQLAAKDFARIRAILHKLKASVLVMGVIPAAEVIRSIELVPLAEMDTPEVAENLQKLADIFDRVNVQLRKL